jgi:anti-sigma regulatory factor (Ser/Thr protein kinase)
MNNLCVPGTLDSLSTIAAFVMKIADEVGLEKKAAYKLRLAVDEITTNTILHGYQEAGLQGNLEFSAQWDASSLTLMVEDTGVDYNPTQHHLPTSDDLSQPLMEREAGGLGIYLVLNGVDEFHYERVGDRNRNIFIMYPSKG